MPPGSEPVSREWLESASARLAAAVGDEPAAYRLAPEDIEAVLELARVAAHESGDRTNAPLLSYLAGLAHARHPSRTLAALVAEIVAR